MPGAVIALLAKPGELLDEGAPMLVLEAMKMEHTLRAPARGRVTRYLCAVGDLVATGLLNDDMPLVRYSVGDRIAVAPSSAGRGG